MGHLPTGSHVCVQFGDANAHEKKIPGIKQGGLSYVPSALGVELYLWAHGKGEQSVGYDNEPNATFEPVEDVLLLPGTRLISELQLELAEQAKREQAHTTQTP